VDDVDLLIFSIYLIANFSLTHWSKLLSVT